MKSVLAGLLLLVLARVNAAAAVTGIGIVDVLVVAIIAEQLLLSVFSVGTVCHPLLLFVSLSTSITELLAAQTDFLPRL